VAKCAEVCRLNGTDYESVDKSHGVQFQNMRMEVRIRAQGKTGRIKVLAANPRTARGFSGDLILDEFAFHEDSAAIWEAAEPILASNPDFLCRIASTGNGKHNLFYRMVSGEARGAGHGARGQDGCQENGVAASRQSAAENADAGNVTGVLPNAATGDTTERGALLREDFNADTRSDAPRSCEITVSSLGYKVSRVPRTMAHAMGVQVYDANTRLPITPEEARAQALDKHAYDQNYECAFADENMTLLTHGLISAAEREDVGFICNQEWSAEFLTMMRGEVTAQQELRPTGASPYRLRVGGDLYVGVDVGRNRDLTVITVMEKIGDMHFVRGILRLAQMRLPEQQLRLGEVCRLPKFRRCCIDMTGIGLGLTEYSQDKFGQGRIRGINFASTVPLTKKIANDGRARETVRVTEAMATELLSVYEDRRIQHPADGELRDDLRKPEKRTSPGGRVSIAATRDEAGHADHFWSFALALEAAGSWGGGGVVLIERTPHVRRTGCWL
jgi:phage FluMu gp28-like protein